MAWDLNTKDLEDMRRNNPKLYEQISSKFELSNEYNNKQDKIRINKEQINTLNQVDYSYQWASQHPIVSIVINFIMRVFGYKFN
jgi:virulence-associated protein VapD